MNEKIKEYGILANYRRNPKEIIWDLEYSISKLKTRLINYCKTKATLFNTRLEERKKLRRIEREAYRTEFAKLKAKHHDRAIEKAKERGIQKAHGIKKPKPKLTEDQQKAIKTRRNQLSQIGRNLSSLIGTSKQSKKKTKVELKDEIIKTKLEQELKELKKKQKTKDVQVGINPVTTNGGQSNALNNVLSLIGIQKKSKKK